MHEENEVQLAVAGRLEVEGGIPAIGMLVMRSLRWTECLFLTAQSPATVNRPALEFEAGECQATGLVSINLLLLILSVPLLRQDQSVRLVRLEWPYLCSYGF